jgi:hypothetical protein
MAKRPDGGKRREITAKDVFDRSNMPSRWERLTGVGPKIPKDRKFLNFVAARYCGEPRLPHPRQLSAQSSKRRPITGGSGLRPALRGSAPMVCGSATLMVCGTPIFPAWE